MFMPSMLSFPEKVEVDDEHSAPAWASDCARAGQGRGLDEPVT
jgi:hypothetical protein